MNSKITHSEVQDFIAEHLDKDLNKTILKGSPFDGISIQELAQQIAGKKTAQKKLPLWAEKSAIYFPPKINLEQCSSALTAAYKTKLLNGNSIIDLTGGFGVDCLYFAKKLETVIHCELDENLSKITQHNAKILSIDNLTSFEGDSLTTLKKLNRKFDWIYVDPSRRNNLKGKVFLLKDCQPNVPENLDFLFEFTNNILVKNSPILDISNTIQELKHTKEIHVIAVGNEVKELLFVLEKNYKGSISIITSNQSKLEQQTFSFKWNFSATANYSAVQKYLYEPNAAILKSGGFQQLSAQLQIDKLQQHSHLYTSNKLHIDFPGRKFVVQHTVPYDKKKILSLLTSKKANISVRNFPETVAQIRKKTKIKDGGEQYLFFTTNHLNKLTVLICRKAL
ncbi:MAG: class I SAM-dependent methyltransferase [Flavicella sp.]